MPVIHVVMPTWQNRKQRDESIRTIVTNTRFTTKIWSPSPDMSNLGWMGFCNVGIKQFIDNNESQYIVLSNDDILVSPASDWAKEMTDVMNNDETIGALSCTTNAAAGWVTPKVSNFVLHQPFQVPYLSFYFVMLRKEALKKIGYLDENIPGGDDIDMCIRLKDAGYKCAVTAKVFIWHYYAQTGKSMYGGYWDSSDHTQKINNALIRKHGFKKYIYTMFGHQEEEVV